MLRSGKFPLASPLPSTASAAARAALFGDFTGTIGQSDFPLPCIIGVRPQTSRCGLQFPLPQTETGSPGSHVRCFLPCLGSQAARAAAEAGEGRGLAKGNLPERNTPRTLSRTGVFSALGRVRQFDAMTQGGSRMR